MPHADIALVWNAPVRLVDITTRFEPYVEGLRDCGLNAVTVCPIGSDEGYPYPVKTFTDENEIANSRFWSELACRAVVVITWHRMTNILLAARAAGLRTLAICESDGQISPRLHPFATFRFATFLQQTIRGKLGAARLWLRKFLFSASSDHQALVANTAATDISTLAGEGPLEAYRGFLVWVGAGHLTPRLAWLPYPIPDTFCSGPVPVARPRRIIAVGRWDSPQKNSALLARTVERLVKAGDQTEILIVGRGGEERFAGPSGRPPRVKVLGIQPRDRIRDLMLGCRAILISSRWEGCPVVANEMLALGGTVIGTPIPSLIGITAMERFGRVSSNHSSAALAAAVRTEMATWDRGERDPEAIASHWRPIVSPVGVARRMIELLRLSHLVRQEVPG